MLVPKRTITGVRSRPSPRRGRRWLPCTLLALACLVGAPPASGTETASARTLPQAITSPAGHHYSITRITRRGREIARSPRGVVELIFDERTLTAYGQCGYMYFTWVRARGRLVATLQAETEVLCSGPSLYLDSAIATFLLSRPVLVVRGKDILLRRWPLLGRGRQSG